LPTIPAARRRILHRIVAAVSLSPALRHMQLLGMRRAVNIDDRLVVHADGIEHERVALVMVDRLATFDAPVSISLGSL
jgi:hypothetical protein